MPTFRRSVDIRAPVESVFAFHLDPANLERMSPPETRTRVVACSEVPLRLGSRVTVQSVQMGMPITLEAEVVALDKDRLFEDRQVRGPFKSWRHRHLFEPIPGGTRLTDEVEFELPGGIAGRLIGQGVVMEQIERAFAFRQAETRRLLEGQE